MTAESSEEMQDDMFITIGGAFSSARKSAGLSVTEAAEKLYVQPYYIDALESEDFSVFESRVFALGYIRKYALLLELDEKEMLDKATALLPETVKDGPTLKKPPETQFVSARRTGQSIDIARALTWMLLGLAVVTVTVLWWMGFLSLPGVNRDAAETEPQAQQTPLQQSIELGGESEDEGLLSIPEESAEMEIPIQEAAADEAELLQQSTPEELLEEESTITAEEMAAMPVEDEIPEAEVPVEEMPAEEVLVEADGVSTEVEISLSFSGQCWVDIRNAEGKVLVSGMLRSGTSKIISATPPLSVVFGKSEVVTMLVDGEPYDLTRHSNSGVARFKLISTDFSQAVE
ncbi:RodZ domain-containing protein [Solemya elarraichensis gill symbiont]|uniref:Cytoskeleton protein RodZ-like C-terminal domain-containing protein n=1 Tax=Solemya elarraichensis gill symbiont TaxID=1918949 RepID=A0A1T2KZY7_9GAMM|nr:RodZ domain-containing protein [Solemya elarraichensis gill symbiont]OOZ38364.1 hypothetical protein BOW52_08705 [Solemya elarraichensis gill symbiont]